MNQCIEVHANFERQGSAKVTMKPVMITLNTLVALFEYQSI